MPIITISGTPINFPSSSQQPNWAPAVIQFATLTAAALNSVIGPYDVVAQTLTINNNVNTNFNVDPLNFPVSAVRGATIDYAVYRKSDTDTQVEKGFLLIAYNADSGGAKWELARVKVGDATITFQISDTGQISFTTVALPGIYETGTLTFSAKSLEQT